MNVARIQIHKRIRSSPFTRKQWSTLQTQITKFDFSTLEKVQWDKKHGICSYCERTGVRLTKEHLLPKCYGGKCILIRVCKRCNSNRGNSYVYPPFIRFIKRNPTIWREAKREASPQCAKSYGIFLNNVKEALKKSLY